MIILGIHNDIDSGICLLRDGVVIEAVNEERFARIKQFEGFPELSLAYVLDKYSLSLSDIDYFAYGWYGKSLDYPHYACKLAKRIIHALSINPTCGKIIQNRLNSEVNNDEDTSTVQRKF
jgi:predicted NodU family carbamoyl transferase